MQVTIVDVFAEQKYAGNQLAVVEDAAGLSSQQMLDIAREMNFSETTFVTARGAEQADVRIFTPMQELPFAGHPTLGTAWVLSGGEGTITLNLAAGPVAVNFTQGLGWLTPPPVTLGSAMSPQDAAALLGLPVAAIDQRFPCRFAEVGPKFIIIGVAGLAELKAAQVHVPTYHAYLERGDASNSIFVFCTEPYRPEAHYAARMFFNVNGIREDPATGSANCAFAAYLLDMQGEVGLQIVDQGVEIQRPSTLYLKVQSQLAVGGRVVQSLAGRLT